MPAFPDVDLQDLYNVTIGFDPTELSTVIPHVTTATCYDPRYGTNPMYAIYESSWPPPQPVDYAHIAQNCSTIEGYQYFPDNPSLRFAGGKFCTILLSSVLIQAGRKFIRMNDSTS